jgi:hypothetical protein
MPKRFGWVFISIALLLFLVIVLHILPFVAYVSIPVIALFLLLGIIVLVFGSDRLHEINELEGHETEFDYYSKKFAPVWRRYILFLKIYLGIFIPGAALFIILASDTVYWQYGFAVFLAIAAVVPFYFAFRVRCTRCGRHLILWPFGLGIGRTYFWMVGICPGCGVRLKNRTISKRSWKIIQVAVITICIITMLAVLYRMFNH